MNTAERIKSEKSLLDKEIKLISKISSPPGNILKAKSLLANLLIEGKDILAKGFDKMSFPESLRYQFIAFEDICHKSAYILSLMPGTIESDEFSGNGVCHLAADKTKCLVEQSSAFMYFFSDLQAAQDWNLKKLIFRMSNLIRQAEIYKESGNLRLAERLELETSRISKQIYFHPSFDLIRNDEWIGIKSGNISSILDLKYICLESGLLKETIGHAKLLWSADQHQITFLSGRDTKARLQFDEIPNEIKATYCLECAIDILSRCMNELRRHCE